MKNLTKLKNIRCVRPTKPKGFTLIELLIYMGLLSLFLVVLVDVLVAIMDVRLESGAVSSVEQDGRYILSRLSYDINSASSITMPTSLGASGSTLTIIISGSTYTYSVVSGNLQVVINGSETINLNSSETTVSSPTFQRIGNTGGKDTIKLQFTVNSVTQRKSGSETRIFKTTAGRR